MNLADAIRQAALRQAEEQGPKAQEAREEPVDNSPSKKKAQAQPEPQPMTQAEAPEATAFDAGTSEAPQQDWVDTGKLTISASPEQVNEIFASDSVTGEPVSMPDNPAGFSGNAVRFEIFLSPEQLSCLFRALVATQHSMMTLREAAHYLRIPAATLEQLAAESKIPALQFEGRWRFPKSGIDEWVMLQSFRDGEVNDAA